MRHNPLIQVVEMEITGKYLLNQAENILKDRKHESRTSRSTGSSDQRTNPVAGTDRFDQGVLESRMLQLQSSIRDIQNAYSREQTRNTYLTDYPDEITQDLTFNNEPLFPELKQKMPLESLRDSVKERLSQLSRDLKGVQVEMENVLALNYNVASVDKVESKNIDGNVSFNPLDPDRVAHLTRG